MVTQTDLGLSIVYKYRCSPPFIFFTHSSLLLSAEILQKLLLPLLISLDSNLILFLERLHSRISISLNSHSFGFVQGETGQPLSSPFLFSVFCRKSPSALSLHFFLCCRKGAETLS
jgi:hypothetical protein